MTPGPFPDFWVGPGDEASLEKGPGRKRGESGRSECVHMYMGCVLKLEVLFHHPVYV